MDCASRRDPLDPTGSQLAMRACCLSGFGSSWQVFNKAAFPLKGSASSPPAQELITDSQQELEQLLGLFSSLQITAEQRDSGERERITVWSRSHPVS